MQNINIKKSFLQQSGAGFSLVELLVGVAVFTLISVAVYSAYTSIFNIVYSSRAKLDAVDLANEELEIIRNLPYADVGIFGGIPPGKLAHTQTVFRGASSFDVTITIRNVDDPFDGTAGGTPNDTAPADYKIAEVEINCQTCKNFKPIDVTTRVAPKNLEAASTNGSLFIKVFDANGNPVTEANIHITNSQSNPPITIDDVTNINGMLQIVDTPPGVNAYNIAVTKSGYSGDQTFPATAGNPNPVKPPATVVLQQVTQVSFIIDKMSSFSISSVTQTCNLVPNTAFNMKGSKLLGTNPSVLKYDQDKVTNGSGALSVPSLEWDSYAFTLNDTNYDLVGMNPISPINLIPNSNQSVQLVVAPKNPKTVLITVKDSVTSLPLSDVNVTIAKSGFASTTKTTGQGFINQTDWSGGGGQATSTDLSKYFSSDGNIEGSLPVGDVVLKKLFGYYLTSGNLTSSSFDTGSPSNFQKIEWKPVDQPVSVGSPNVRLQIATNNDGGAWNFSGPDGTSATYYTLGNQNISSSNNSKQFLRYRLFLDTASTTATPNVSDISFTFTSSCTPPGQVLFSGLFSGTYNIHLSKSGFVDQDLSLDVSSAWQSLEVTLLPN